jgi:hypothetical protein
MEPEQDKYGQLTFHELFTNDANLKNINWFSGKLTMI